MTRLTVLYDADCAFCQRCRAWAMSQAQYFPVRFIAKSSDQAHALYPQVVSDFADDELLAIGDDGGVYRGANAWLMCLYALRAYRPLALRLARPGMRGLARRAFNFISHHRHRVPHWLLRPNDPQLAARLQTVREPMRCADEKASQHESASDDSSLHVLRSKRMRGWTDARVADQPAVPDDHQ